MTKIEITICTGTTCYVMGAGRLLLLQDELSDRQRQQVEIKGSNCLGLCKQGQYGKAPYARVGDKIIAEATPEAVLTAIGQCLGESGEE
jgi:NADH:ubiquinone oxidoreductase subunit E